MKAFDESQHSMRRVIKTEELKSSSLTKLLEAHLKPQPMMDLIIEIHIPLSNLWIRCQSMASCDSKVNGL